jgi:hypothetical protein
MRKNMNKITTPTPVSGLRVRRWYAFVEDVALTEFGVEADGDSLRKLAIAAAVENPYVDQHSETLEKLIDPSPQLGTEIGQRLLKFGDGTPIESYGKGCVVGAGGEYEHGNALLTTRFADPIREAIGGGKSWIPSTGKVAGPGAVIDLPLANKDALYVRSHYDTFTLYFGDGPRSDEIIVIFAVASRGRLHSRVGGLTTTAVVGEDGLR